MYHYNNFESWQDHHGDLLREAQQRRLAQQLRAARSGENALRPPRSLSRLVADLLPRSRKTAGC